MTLVTLYLSTAAIFLILDALMLTLVTKPLFARHVPHLLREDILWAPAAAFYLCYLAGLVYLVSWPGLKQGAPVLLPAAIIGAMAYGTYAVTSWAVTKGWHPAMVAVDTAWGTALTAAAARRAAQAKPDRDRIEVTCVSQAFPAPKPEGATP